MGEEISFQRFGDQLSGEDVETVNAGLPSMTVAREGAGVESLVLIEDFEMY